METGRFSVGVESYKTPPEFDEIHRICTKSGRILTRFGRISMRSRHFSTNRTKTTGEMLPSMENNDFFWCNMVRSVLFKFSCSNLSTDPRISDSRGGDPPLTRHRSWVGWLSDRIGWIGRWVGSLVGVDTPVSTLIFSNPI